MWRERVTLRKFIFYGLAALLLLLQYPLWFGGGGLLTLWKISQEIGSQKEENRNLKERNLALEAEVNDLKQGLESIEERARHDLGMVKKGETFYRVIENPANQKPEPAPR
jgi:cell division protein FtsB